MIADTLLIPTERPLYVRDIKRSLLSFDHVHVPSPDDRDVIPPEAFLAASSPMGFFPLAINSGPIRPLGKAPRYDEMYEQAVEECSFATKQGSLNVLETPLSHDGLTIGNRPLPENFPHPTFVYQTYRSIASHPEFIAAISRGLEVLPPLSEDLIDTMVPPGLDDNGLQYFVNGVQQAGLPSPVQYHGMVSSEVERNVLTKLCLARLGATVKYLALCHVRQYHPYTSDPGVASVIQMLSHNTRIVMETTYDSNNSAAFAERIRILHDLMLSEFIDPEALDALSVKQILQLRSKAWGKAQEARTALAKNLRNIALDNPDITDFQKACSQAINEYKRAQSDLEHEWKKLRVKTICDLGILAAGIPPMYILQGTELMQKILPLGTLETILVIGGVVFGSIFKEAKEKTPEIMDLIKQSKEVRETSGYALFRPYIPFQ